MSGADLLDAHDKAIIRALQVDGRMPYTQLAPLVGLSEAATRQRVNKLTRSGAIQIVAVTDPITLGLPYQALVGITVDADVTQVAADLAGFDEVDYVVIVTGRFDILAEVVCSDADHLLDVVNDRLRPLPGVKSTEVFTYLRLVKQSYNWGTG